MTIDEKIDVLLNEIKKEKFVSKDNAFLLLVNNHNKEDIKDFSIVKNILNDENIVTIKEGYNLSLTSFGRNIIQDYGSWIKYKEHLKEEQNRKQQKEIYDLRLAKWQSDTFWYWFFIAIVGGISGIIALVIELIE